MREIRKRGRAVWDRLGTATEDRTIASNEALEETPENRDWGRITPPEFPDIRGIRKRLRLSQSGFAKRFGFSVRTIQEWEQGRAIPDRPARILLRVIERSPRAVERAVAAG